MMQKASILIIDDEESLLNLFARLLTLEGHDVELAGSGDEGIRKYKSGQYDLVITDLVMGRMGGMDVLREIKKLNPDAFILLLTGRGSLDSAIEAIRMGASDYLLKPCSGDELNVRVKDNLERKALVDRIRFYENILPVCCVCKKIRDDSQRMPGQGEWMEFAEFAKKKRNVEIKEMQCDQCSNMMDSTADN